VIKTAIKKPEMIKWKLQMPERLATMWQKIEITKG
jgi:hypothetical protein